MSYQQYNDKLLTELGEMLPETSKFYILIIYSANGSNPPDGFVFIESQDGRAFQAWTQGETTASKKWFPCIDHPQVKYPRQLSVIVPDNYTTISNGERNVIEQEVLGEKKKKFVWEENHPITSYVTSAVVGDFAELPTDYFDKRIPLLYFVPKGREKEGLRLFKNTPKMMEFFESYLETKYQYDKYSQVTVEDFEFGGMENTTCTTFTTRILPNEKTARDDETFDQVVVHELAHQWFGDLATCRDWQHIWLNESFASYCEALYYQNTLGDDGFYYYMIGKVDDYLNAKGQGIHDMPLVTNNYEEPMDMFTYERTYQKGACIVYMMRSMLNEDDFKKSLKQYFELYKNSTAETDDLRKVFEQNSGLSFTKFFEQWLYQAGHPELDVLYSIKGSLLNILIRPVQSHKFDFSIDIIVVVKMSSGEEKIIEDSIVVGDKETENEYNIPNGATIKRIAIDPYLKVLKKINIVDSAINQSLQLDGFNNGKTVVEKISAVRSLRNSPNNELIPSLKAMILREDVHWGIRSEASITLGSIKTDESYESLRDCLGVIKNNKVKAKIIQAMGSFSKSSLFDLLKPTLENDSEADLVRYQAAIAIAQGRKEEMVFPVLVKLLDTQSHKNIVARGGIEGLKILAVESDSEDIINQIVSISIEKSQIGNESTLRQSAISSLGYIARYHKYHTKIVDQLKSLLSDKSLYVRNTAFASIGNIFEYSQDVQLSQNILQKIKEEDNSFVKKTANKALQLINKKPPLEMNLAVEKSFLKDKDYRIEEIDALEKSITLY